MKQQIAKDQTKRQHVQYIWQAYMTFAAKIQCRPQDKASIIDSNDTMHIVLWSTAI